MYFHLFFVHSSSNQHAEQIRVYVKQSNGIVVCHVMTVPIDGEICRVQCSKKLIDDTPMDAVEQLHWTIGKTEQPISSLLKPFAPHTSTISPAKKRRRTIALTADNDFLNIRNEIIGDLGSFLRKDPDTIKRKFAKKPLPNYTDMPLNQADTRQDIANNPVKLLMPLGKSRPINVPTSEKELNSYAIKPTLPPITDEMSHALRFWLTVKLLRDRLKKKQELNVKALCDHFDIGYAAVHKVYDNKFEKPEHYMFLSPDEYDKKALRSLVERYGTDECKQRLRNCMKLGRSGLTF